MGLKENIVDHFFFFFLGGGHLLGTPIGPPLETAYGDGIDISIEGRVSDQSENAVTDKEE